MLGYGGFWKGIGERAMRGLAKTPLRRREGQTMVEYALILSLLALVVIIAVTALTGNLSTLFSSVGDQI